MHRRPNNTRFSPYLATPQSGFLNIFLSKVFPTKRLEKNLKPQVGIKISLVERVVDKEEELGQKRIFKQSSYVFIIGGMFE